jgi:hypothetical protein
MKPEDEPWKGELGEGLSARALVKPGEAYLVYFCVAAGKSGDYAVRWTGSLEPALSETYTFHTTSNDGVRLWVDGKPIIDNWTEHAATEDHGKIDLLGGRKVPIKLEFFQGTGGAVIKLAWSSPSLRKEIVPAEALSTPDGTERGLAGEYFGDRNLGKRAFARVDPRIDFDWTVASPFTRTAAPSGELRVAPGLEAPAGRYQLAWIDTKTGAVVRASTVKHAGGKLPLESPPFRYDIALTVRAVK